MTLELALSIFIYANFADTNKMFGCYFELIYKYHLEF